MTNATHELKTISVAERLEKYESVDSPMKAAKLLADMMPALTDDRREAVVALYLDAGGRPVAEPYVLSVGDIDCSLCSPKAVFRPAIETGAVGVILAHNHPSGDPRPSDEDRGLFSRLHSVGMLLDIQVLDSLSVGLHEFYSCAAKKTFRIDTGEEVN